MSTPLFFTLCRILYNIAQNNTSEVPARLLSSSLPVSNLHQDHPCWDCIIAQMYREHHAAGTILVYGSAASIAALLCSVSFIFSEWCKLPPLRFLKQRRPRKQGQSACPDNHRLALAVVFRRIDCVLQCVLPSGNSVQKCEANDWSWSCN